MYGLAMQGPCLRDTELLREVSEALARAQTYAALKKAPKDGTSYELGGWRFESFRARQILPPKSSSWIALPAISRFILAIHCGTFAELLSRTAVDWVFLRYCSRYFRIEIHGEPIS